ncbi:prephenate/arogenate dehydrogenase [Funiculus sociatus GB2-A5]|uniref:Prephenate/arogenate dehydrogenase n=1 Tax=Funiculus sociatus GB2-A5 TaxID=2933946 RepID=A0ABV0JSH6_9CYAN|nr:MULTISPECIES: prephenate/arogenate dehydrogenase [unclassified Trichocoleus]MBD1904798.1 prephenate/arogenate dehydrogenase [Trichocoleus sp. FACHB-832]MBD2063619.1 prephenate/arogenate dehydrogenase [Trichocoleus sp. FACHB-6]
MNIGIVGLGLIGGSLGLDLRAAGYQVLGVSRRDKVCRDAIARGVVDDATVDMALLAAADVVFVCTPISAIASTVQQLIPHLSGDAIITDVGSVKKSVVEAITPLWANFVGGHPMAGTAESGLEAAVQNLFVGKAYVLTPVATTPPAAVKTVEEIVRSLEAEIYHCSPENHDKAVARISHLPVMVSATLIDACISETDPVVLELAQQLASSGFRDTSRVGGGNPELGLMMARYNRLELLQSLQQYRHCLDEIISQIEQEDWNGLHSKLTTTQSKRSQFC